MQHRPGAQRHQGVHDVDKTERNGEGHEPQDVQPTEGRDDVAKDAEPGPARAQRAHAQHAGGSAGGGGGRGAFFEQQLRRRHEHRANGELDVGVSERGAGAARAARAACRVGRTTGHASPQRAG